MKYINTPDIQTIFELGTRDLNDAKKLYKIFHAQIYAFECNPDCITVCKQNLSNMTDTEHDNIHLIENAVSEIDGHATFYPFDLQQYNNMGASSMLKIDFSKRNVTDPDFNRPNPQKEITVPCIRLDSFIEQHQIQTIDMICMDLQGYELSALKSLGKYLHSVKYIISECSIKSTYTNGATFKEVYEYLQQFGFEYVEYVSSKPSKEIYEYLQQFRFEYVSSKSSFGQGDQNPSDIDIDGFSEFDCLFIRK